MGFFTDTEFDSTADMLDAINEVVERNVHSNFTKTTADALGLDIRAGYTIYVNEDYVATNNRGSLDYYGGFEYVDKESVTTVGDWTFYDGYEGRVRDCIDTFYQRETEEEAE